MADEPVLPANEVFLPDESAPEIEDAKKGAESQELNTSRPGGHRRQVRPIFRWLPIVLFLGTCVTTFWAGCQILQAPLVRVDAETGRTIRYVEKDPVTGRFVGVLDVRKTILNGLYYALAVMATLAAHEAGHYLLARRHRVPATLPMFIPMPIGPIGTMGAVIFQDSGVANRKALFDIAIAGPLAGLAIALPLNWWGVKHSQIGEILPNTTVFTNPKIVEWMIGWIHHPLRPGEDIAVNSMLHAGWVGIFITALNLMPIGQLDGGHILYCLIGKRAHHVARFLWLAAVACVGIQLLLGHFEYVGWIIMLSLLYFMGTRHPPSADDRMPLGLPRILLGWLTLAFIFVGFIPTPMYIAPSRNPAAAESPATLPTEQSGEMEPDAEILPASN
jgi:Zn-dependent protease